MGHRLRLVAVVDALTREALAIDVDTSRPRERVVQVPGRLVADRGLPRELVLDNGPELAGRALDCWDHEQGIRLRFIGPGKPVQNAVVERGDGRLRDGCRNERRFLSLADARRIAEGWREDNDRTRPHGAPPADR